MPQVGEGGSQGELSIDQIAQYWLDAGGSAAHRIDAVGVALAESGGDPTAVSPSHDYGLWQINRIHFGDGTISASNWFDPAASAREAVRLSGGGKNWAAWCTAWDHPAGNCGHGYLPHPQSGSPAASEAAIVAIFLGGVSLSTHADKSGQGTAGVLHSWSYVQQWLHTWGPGAYNNTTSYQKLIRDARSGNKIGRALGL